MRPVNLIPSDQRRRRGAYTPPSARRTPTEYAAYGLLGFLALALVGVVVLVLTSNKINDKKDTVAKIKEEAATAQVAADALRPYGQFKQLQEARVGTIRSLSATTFNWARVLHALSRTMPSDAWLTSVKGTVRPNVDLEGGGTAGSVTGLRTKSAAPALELVGCTYTHSGVARMMTRMRNIEGVSEVVLGNSERPASATGAAGGAGGGDDCRTRPKITRFDLLVVFGEQGPPGTPNTASYPRGATAQALAARTTANRTNQALTNASPGGAGQ
jgi:Tfp pilus assembly protein PilN